ncbi:hypothetical protein EL26_24285 [Tumebacillus flagellatus]|uniref:Copper amine oxidase-like N-terminal domain-containing protein n=2 Tax=Tumebacillus flagellatus TaxID=1157490 RepID=A0A074LJN6_9BACL|nr:hypothetical protein EL26_24285 [Tumebacillus flagellatus]
MVPIRFISEAMGADVTWYAKAQWVVIQLPGKEIQLIVGDDTAYVGGLETKLDTKCIMKDDRTYVPLRFVSEAMGATVGWDGNQNLVTISYNRSAADNPHSHPSAYSGDLWGRETRTTDLPKNASDFPYVLADLPNEMYEMPYRKITDDPIELPITLYAEQEFTKQNIDLWTGRVRTYYQHVLNVDYNTIDSTWVDEFYGTINPGGRDRNRYLKYVNWVKQNHIQIEGSIEPEPSMIYKTWHIYTMRNKVTFRIVNYDQDKDVMLDSMYPVGRFKKGVWYTGYADIGLGTMTMGNWGPTLAVNNDASLVANSNIHEKP